MQSFDYIAPKNMDETIVLLASRNGDTKILAGGTDLIVQLREGRRQAKLVIDVKNIPDLMQVTADENGLRIGAAAACHDICSNPIVQQKYP